MLAAHGRCKRIYHLLESAPDRHIGMFAGSNFLDSTDYTPSR
jgi:hypothetical protein